MLVLIDNVAKLVNPDRSHGVSARELGFRRWRLSLIPEQFEWARLMIYCAVVFVNQLALVASGWGPSDRTSKGQRPGLHWHEPASGGSAGI